MTAFLVNIATCNNRQTYKKNSVVKAVKEHVSNGKRSINPKVSLLQHLKI
jgi:hypothetical protein